MHILSRPNEDLKDHLDIDIEKQVIKTFETGFSVNSSYLCIMTV
jgi:hypothetical protein